MGMIVIAFLFLAFAICYRAGCRLAGLHVEMEMMKLTGKVQPKPLVIGETNPETILSVGESTVAAGTTDMSGNGSVATIPGSELLESEAVGAPVVLKAKRKRAPRKPKVDPMVAAHQANSLAKVEMESRLAAELVEIGAHV